MWCVCVHVCTCLIFICGESKNLKVEKVHVKNLDIDSPLGHCRHCQRGYDEPVYTESACEPQTQEAIMPLSLLTMPFT